MPDTQRRRLSSLQTFIFKFLFPPLWIIGFGHGTVLMWQENPPVPDDWSFPISPRWIFVIAWVFGSAMIGWMLLGLKRVATDGKQLWISNYLREIVVPLADVTEIKEWRWTEPRLVTLHLRLDHGMGETMRFMARVRMFLFWRAHPDVTWLREVTRQAGGLR